MQMIAVLLIKLLNVLTWLIIIQCLMSWFPGARYSRAYEILSMFNVKLHVLKEGDKFDLLKKIPFEEDKYFHENHR